MKFMVIKSGGRKFRCIDCDMPVPLQLPEVEKLLSGASGGQSKAAWSIFLRFG
jgi:hypothetical protein